MAAWRLSTPRWATTARKTLHDFYVTEDLLSGSLLRPEKFVDIKRVPGLYFGDILEKYRPTFIICDIEGGEYAIFSRKGWTFCPCGKCAWKRTPRRKTNWPVWAPFFKNGALDLIPRRCGRASITGSARQGPVGQETLPASFLLWPGTKSQLPS